MNKIKMLKGKSLLLLVAAIGVLCVGFIVVGCGSGSQSSLKVVDPDAGAFAVDFTDCPTSVCYAFKESKTLVERKMAEKELTVEAWVKKDSLTADIDFDGAIFGRFDAGGITLYVKDGVPKAAIRRTVGTGDETTTVDYIADSKIAAAVLGDAAWHHLAAVLTSANHDNAGTHPDKHAPCTNNQASVEDCGATGTCEDSFHLDIYVDGVFQDCNTTLGHSDDNAVYIDLGYSGEPFDEYPILQIGMLANTDPIDGIATGTLLKASIDESRLWTRARTKAEIQACKDVELGYNSGTCGRRTDDLIAYFRFNEGTGHSISEWTGLGSGSIEKVGGTWEDGWVAGAPIIPAD